MQDPNTRVLTAAETVYVVNELAVPETQHDNEVCITNVRAWSKYHATDLGFSE